MVTNNRTLDAAFAALADPTRRAIVARLARGETTVGDLARPFHVSRPAVSKHLRVLERAGLVRRKRDGRVGRCRLDARAMQSAAEWIERYRVFWTNRLGDLERYAEQAPSPPERRPSATKRQRP